MLKGRIESERGKRNKKSLHQQVTTKIERRHQARQIRQNKLRDHAHFMSVFAGRNAAPRIVTVVPLMPDIDIAAAMRNLAASLGIEIGPSAREPCVVQVDRFKQRIQFVPASGELFSTLDACRIADFIILVVSATHELDCDSRLLLRAIESQGVSNVLTVIQESDDPRPPGKKRKLLQELRLSIAEFIPGQEKIHSLESSSECSNMMRSVCTSMPQGVHWRDDRSWMLVDDVQWQEGLERDHNKAVLSGVVRGRGLNPNRLLQIGDWGDFQIESIALLPPDDRKHKSTEMTTEGDQQVEIPDADQDNLDELAPDQIEMEDAGADLLSEANNDRRGVLLDDHHYFSEGDDRTVRRPKRLPKGTSDYQAAWFLDEMSDSGSDMEDLASESSAPMARPEDGTEGLDTSGAQEPTEAGLSEYPQSEAFEDPSPHEEAAELAAYRASRREAAAEDVEFPDEIELHPHVLARERLQRYRGLKSLRTSEWETSEDRLHEPADWNRLLRIPNYNAARSSAMREALVGGVPIGTRVQVCVKDVSTSIQAQDQHRAAQGHPLTAFSLLRHEHKRTVMNYSISLRSDYPAALKSKSEVIVQCGARRFVSRPVFSASGTTPNDVHKFDRYLHPGRTAVASMVAPLIWGAVPVMYFARRPNSSDASSSLPPPSAEQEGPLALIATGTALGASTSRVIAKRIVLTGHPYRINRRLVTIRYMFFNSEDVRWFAALPMWTRRGRSGFIKEPLGTHGQFKATFDGRINPQDAVGVSLYKRIWPRDTRPWTAEEVWEEIKKQQLKREVAGLHGRVEEMVIDRDEVA